MCIPFQLDPLRPHCIRETAQSCCFFHTNIICSTHVCPLVSFFLFPFFSIHIYCEFLFSKLQLYIVLFSVISGSFLTDNDFTSFNKRISVLLSITLYIYTQKLCTLMHLYNAQFCTCTHISCSFSYGKSWRKHMLPKARYPLIRIK